jgi:acyl-CoA-binding protein
VTQPWAELKDEAERAAKQKAMELIEKLKARGDRLRKEREEKKRDE